MIRFTVVWDGVIQNTLADLWMRSSDRRAITDSGDKIDEELKQDAHVKGVDLGDGQRGLAVAPLAALFTVSLNDRMVRVWKIIEIP